MVKEQVGAFSFVLAEYEGEKRRDCVCSSRIRDGGDQMTCSTTASSSASVFGHADSSDDDIVRRCWCLHELHTAFLLRLEREVSLGYIVLDLVDPKQHDRLAVTLRLLVALSAFLLEDHSLVALQFLLDSCINSRVLDLRSTDRCVVHGSNHEDVIEADLGTDLEGQLLHSDNVIVENFRLHASDSHNGEDLVRVRRNGHTFLRAVHVHHGILSCDRLLIGLADCSLSFLSLLSFQWLLPLTLDFLVLGHRVHSPCHRLAATLVQILEELAHTPRHQRSHQSRLVAAEGQRALHVWADSGLLRRL